MSETLSFSCTICFVCDACVICPICKNQMDAEAD